MLKTILVPTSGSRTDEIVFATAVAVGRPVAAHLEFLHVHVTAGEAAAHAPHVDFCIGPAIAESLRDLRDRGHALSVSARRHFEDLCSTNGIEVRRVPGSSTTLTADWNEETDHAMARLMYHARHSDLTVVGRRRNTDYLQAGLIENLLEHCGRPIAIAPESIRPAVLSTIVVGWKERPEAARALGAALPLLERADRVVLLSIAEEGAASREALEHLARQLAWHGIAAEVRVAVGDGSAPATAQLPRIAREVGADLIVAGAFGHAPMRELVFGGVTRSLIEHADVPVLLMR
jgi:nucleotide-binding universal stress UspA family protein